MPRAILFLDIDGVLHPASAELSAKRHGGMLAVEDIRVGIVRGSIRPGTFGLLCIERQRLLAEVLDSYPDVSLVVSSAWRHWEGYNVLRKDGPSDPEWEEAHVRTLNWLKRLLLPEIAQRIVGRTDIDSTDAPVLAKTRLDEIRDFMRAHGPELGAESWVALDDVSRNFPLTEIAPFYSEHEGRSGGGHRSRREVLVLLDGEKGLTVASASALAKAIEHANVMSAIVP